MSSAESTGNGPAGPAPGEPPSPTASPPQDLVERVVTELKTAVLREDYEPDGVLPSQGKLCTILGVSRSVVREAMRILQSQGFIEISQGRRPRVKPVNSQGLVDSLDNLVQRAHISRLELIEVRLPLESEIASHAAERAQPEHLERLQSACEALERAKDLESQSQADIDFHQGLAEATGNPAFILLLESLATLLHETRCQTLGHEGAEMCTQEHRGILAAVESRNAAEARRLMQVHLEKARQDILQHPDLEASAEAPPWSGS